MDSGSRPICIIPAAGQSRRFVERGYPNKSDVVVRHRTFGAKTMIGHCVDSAAQAGFDPYVIKKQDVPNSIGQADTVRRGLNHLIALDVLKIDNPVVVLNSDVVLMNPEAVARDIHEAIGSGFQCVLSAKNILSLSFFNPAMSYCYPANRPWIFQEKPKFWIPGAQALTGFYMFAHAGRLLECLEWCCSMGDGEVYLSEVFYAYAHVTMTVTTRVSDWGTPELLDADPDVLEWS